MQRHENILLVFLYARARVFHLDRARCDLNSRSDHALSFLSILMPLNIWKITFFISPLLSFFYSFDYLYVYGVFSNDDSYIDGKR